MKDEIKEIKINKSNNSITFINGEIAYSQFGIATEILNLITSLQEENQRLREHILKKDKVYSDLEDKYITLKARIDKAIEYINNHKEQLHHSFDGPDFDYLLCANADELLNILQGDDNNGD